MGPRCGLDGDGMTSGDKEPVVRKDSAGRESGNLSRAIALGTNMAAGMAVFSFLGYWIDKWRGGSGAGPWTLAGMFLGLLYGGYEVWKVVRLLDKGAPGKDPGASAGEGKQ